MFLRQQISLLYTDPQAQQYKYNWCKAISPIKSREDLDHHQVGTWKLKCTRQNQTTDKKYHQAYIFLIKLS